MIKVIIYEESEDELCCSCKHGYGIILNDDDLYEGHICFVNCKDNDGENCPKYEKNKKTD